MKRFALSLTCVLALWGCTPATPRVTQTAQMLMDLQGALTYEQALAHFGIPARCEATGATRVCEWRRWQCLAGGVPDRGCAVCRYAATVAGHSVLHR